MSLRAFRSLAFQIAMAMTLLILGVGALIVWQVDGILHDNEHQRYSESLIRARAQFQQQLETDLDLAVTGATVLAADPQIRAAILANDAVEVLRITSDYSARVGTPLHGKPGMQVYDDTGRLIVRAHDPLRGRQEETPEPVRYVLSNGEAIGVLQEDELLGLSLDGVAPVFDDDGDLIGAVEALTGLDRSFILDQERLLGTRVVLRSPDTVISAEDGETFDVTSSFTPEAEAAATADDPATVTFGGAEEYLAVLLPLTNRQNEHVGDIILAVDKAIIHAGIADIREYALRTATIGGGIAIVLAFGLAYLAVRPIRDLVTAARRIQANDLDTEIDTGGPAEVLELGDALDDLRVSLRQTRDAMLSVNRDLATRFEASTATLLETSQELAVMHGILAALGGDAPGGLAGVTEELRELDWVDGAVIALATETGRLSLAAAAGIRPEAAQRLLFTIESGVRGQRLDTGIVVAETEATPEAGQLRVFDIGGFTAQPMVEPDGVAGVVAVTTQDALHLTPSRTDLLRAVAREVAVMLERTELADEVEENRRIAESVLREMSDGVLVINHANQCRVANPAAARLLGRTRIELVGQSAESCLPLSVEGVATLRRRAADPSGAPVAPLLAEIAGRKIAISAGPFVDADPERSGMMVLMRDLSAEAEAERVKQDFVSMVGHELRTPLTLIRTTIDLLHEGDAGHLNETQERIVEVLHANTDRLMALINDLLDMSAIDSGRMQIQPLSVEVSEVVREAVTEAQTAALAKQHQLLTTINMPVTAWVDRKRLGQILSNLIGNAIKYTPAGGTIQVDADVTDDWVQIDVRDNGIGIPPDEQAQLFEKFYRTTQGRRTTGGTGLGLAIARSLVELHGGRIWCSSDGQTGTTFSFTLPRRRI